MADQSTSEPVVLLPPATEDGEIDLTGQSVLSLLHDRTNSIWILNISWISLALISKEYQVKRASTASEGDT
jgi:hypothetical protein